MKQLLGFIQGKLHGAEVPYEFGEWSAAVTYPYFVGGYQESDASYEDNQTVGVFTLDGWARGKNAKLVLAEYSDKIKKLFLDLTEINKENTLFHVKFSGGQFIQTGEDDLDRVSITLDVHEWKGND